MQHFTPLSVINLWNYMPHWFGIWFEVSDNYSDHISYSTTLISISSEFSGSAPTTQGGCCAHPFSRAAYRFPGSFNIWRVVKKLGSNAFLIFFILTVLHCAFVWFSSCVRDLWLYCATHTKVGGAGHVLVGAHWHSWEQSFSIAVIAFIIIICHNSF